MIGDDVGECGDVLAGARSVGIGNCMRRTAWARGSRGSSQSTIISCCRCTDCSRPATAFSSGRLPRADRTTIATRASARAACDRDGIFAPARADHVGGDHALRHGHRGTSRRGARTALGPRRALVGHDCRREPTAQGPRPMRSSCIDEHRAPVVEHNAVLRPPRRLPVRRRWPGGWLRGRGLRASLQSALRRPCRPARAWTRAVGRRAPRAWPCRSGCARTRPCAGRTGRRAPVACCSTAGSTSGRMDHAVCHRKLRPRPPARIEITSTAGPSAAPNAAINSSRRWR